MKTALKDYVLSDADYIKVRDVLNAEMDKGLNKSTNKDAIVRMLPTYVRSLPDGSGGYIMVAVRGHYGGIWFVKVQERKTPYLVCLKEMLVDMKYHV